ncbi:MAG: hypothetical protein RL653_748 [Pseudomonadota bacterium]
MALVTVLGFAVRSRCRRVAPVIPGASGPPLAAGARAGRLAPMSLNVTAPSLDSVTRPLDRPAGPAQGRGVGDAVRVSEGTRDLQSPGGPELKAAVASARGLGERLAAEDATGEALGQAAEALRAAQVPEQRAAALAKLDEIAEANPGAGVDRERLGVNGTPDDEALARAQEAVAQVRAEADARRAALVKEAEAAAERLSGTGLPNGEKALEAAERSRQMIASDAVAAIQAQANQAQASAQSLLA